jgi:hypothetical protein
MWPSVFGLQAVNFGYFWHRLFIVSLPS